MQPNQEVGARGWKAISQQSQIHLTKILCLPLWADYVQGWSASLPHCLVKGQPSQPHGTLADYSLPPPPARVGITTPPPTAARPFIFIGCWYFVIENPGGDKSVSLETCGWAGHSPFTCISPVTPIYHNTVPWPQNTVTAQTMLSSTQHWEDHSWSGPIFYLWLSKVLANERRRYLCNVFSHWLRPCSAIDRKQNM